MKVKIWIYTRNLGDGSCAPCFFNSNEEAEKYAESDDERYCNDISEYILEFDENGKLLNPDELDDWI